MSQKYSFDRNNSKFNIIDEIYLEEISLKKSDVVNLNKTNKENNYLAYDINDKKYFEAFHLDKKIIVAKINLNFIHYKFFGNILLFQNQKELNQYVLNLLFELDI